MYRNLEADLEPELEPKPDDAWQCCKLLECCLLWIYACW